MSEGGGKLGIQSPLASSWPRASSRRLQLSHVILHSIRRSVPFGLEHADECVECTGTDILVLVNVHKLVVEARRSELIGCGEDKTVTDVIRDDSVGFSIAYIP